MSAQLLNGIFQFQLEHLALQSIPFPIFQTEDSLIRSFNIYAFIVADQGYRDWQPVRPKLC